MTLTPSAAAQKALYLAEALPYIRRFHGKTIVIKYGGNAMTDLRLQLLRPRCRAAAGRDEPGSGARRRTPDRTAARRLGKKGEFVQGMRVTDAETMDVVEMVLGGAVNKDIVTLINRAGGKAVGLTGQDGHFIHARKLLLPSKERPEELIDIGQVGEIAGIDPGVIDSLEQGGFIPVVAPIGVGPQGESYNINADLVAGKLAEILQAEKLILLTNTPGVLDRDGNLLTGLTSRASMSWWRTAPLRRHAAEDRIRPGRRARRRVKCIIDGRVEHALLLEILTDEGVGTLIRSK